MKGMPKKNRLWVFDFDGTLSEIVPNRHDALLDPSCRVMLERLIKLYDGHVAVLSSRILSDLEARADVPGLFLGGSCGIEWLLPGGERRSFSNGFEHLLSATRSKFFADIKKLQLIRDLDIEDKKWSITFHLRGVAPDKKEQVSVFIKNRESLYAIKAFGGPEAQEVFFLPDLNKVFGIRKFCEFTGTTPEAAQIIYAGDDENDAIAMQWVVDHGGIVYAVGDSQLVPTSRVVKKPLDLSLQMCLLMEEQAGPGSEGGCLHV